MMKRRKHWTKPSLISEQSVAPREKSVGQEKIKMLTLLCDLLDNSLAIASTATEDKVPMPPLPSKATTTTQRSNCITWSASGLLGQKQRKLQQMVKQEMATAATTGNVEMGTIHEEEHEHAGTGVCAVGLGVPGGDGQPEDNHSSTDGESVAERGEMQEAMKCYPPEAELSVYEYHPLGPRLLPHLAMWLVVLLYLLLGAAIFRLIDSGIGAKPWARSFVWAFELLATIGWGDSHASNASSQAFTVLYILLGIPMLFSAYANLGRFITEFCCLWGPRIWAKLSGQGGDASEVDAIQRLPMASIGSLLLLHQCAGLLIYSVWLKHWPPVSTVYFSITTMATSGFGDFHPDTDSWFETMVALVYISLGIVILSALFLTIALYYQALHYIQLKAVFSQVYAKFVHWKSAARKVGDSTEKQQKKTGE